MDSFKAMSNLSESPKIFFYKVHFLVKLSFHWTIRGQIHLGEIILAKEFYEEHLCEIISNFGQWFEMWFIEKVYACSIKKN